MSRRPSPLRMLAGAAAILAVGAAVAWGVFRTAVYEDRSNPVPVAPSAPVAEWPEARVAAVTGAVERSAAGGAWVPLHTGDELHADDAVRTGAMSRADLQVGAGSRLAVAEGTQLTVRALEPALHRFALSRGRVAADYQQDGERALRIETETGDAVVETKGARFSVLSTGLTLAVATETGVVSLQSAGQMVDVRAGEQSVVVSGAPPAAAQPVPAEVLLKVADASRIGSDALCAAVRGRAEPGSEVTVDGAPVRLGADGVFSVQVARGPGREAVTVATRDPSGRVAERRVPCRPAGVSDFSVRWKRGSGT